VGQLSKGKKSEEKGVYQTVMATETWGELCGKKEKRYPYLKSKCDCLKAWAILQG